MTERDIFEAALELPPQDRVGYLDGVCGDDAALRQRLDGLLSKHDVAASFLEKPAVSALATVDEPAVSERPGTVIGPYKLMEQIGEGGMGLVFVAEQQHPVRRKVALKVMKPGMDTRAVVARFEAERQALALMDHPNIAKVHDGGETAGGRPFFVMELIKGVPITDYCDQNRLTPRARLELFLSVCQAVQHAHQKGIIHRDIKPSNVLVTSHDGTLVVKIIDFGVAKAIGQQLTDKTLYTQFTQLVGTPLYMSPEQAGQSGLDIDTRTDIYALGVLLYELLTGTTPFDKDRLGKADYDEMRRIIREEEPPKPSTRISTLGLTAATVSTNRQSDPRQLSRLFRGELDWIVMKALEKDRNRRYPTASAFAADVLRYMRGDAVHACPPSASYLLRKLMLRNRGPVVATATVFVVLLAGVAVSTLQWRRAESRRVRAEQAEGKAQAINDFLIKEMLAAGTPEVGQGHKLTAEEVLDRAAAKIDRAFPDQPEVEAGVRMAIGSAYNALALYAKAEPHLRRALAIREGLLLAEQPETLETFKELGELLIHQGKYAEGERLHRQTLATARRVLGAEHRQTLELEYLVAWLVDAQGRWKEAELLFRECLNKQMRARGEQDPDALETMRSLAEELGKAGKWQEAELFGRRCVEIRERVLGKDHPATLDARATLAVAILRTEGKWREAEAILRETLQTARRVYGPKHHETLTIEHDLGLNLWSLDRLEEAEACFRESIKGRSNYSGPEHPEALKSGLFLAFVLLARGEVGEAEGLLGNVEKATRRARGLDDNITLTALVGLALVRQAKGMWPEAEAAVRQALAARHQRYGSAHPATLRTASLLPVLLDATGKHAEAESHFRTVLEAWQEHYPADHPERAFTLCAWGEHLLAEGDLRQAEPALTEALRVERAALPPDHRAIGQTLCALGWLHAQTGRPQEGERLLRDGLAICRRKWGSRHWVTADAESRLGACLAANGRFAEAEQLLLSSHHTLLDAQGTPPVRRAQAVDRIVVFYKKWPKPEKAAQWQAAQGGSQNHEEKRPQSRSKDR
jgi:serine/threonine protein kinase/tetratricopeptide (TPR) repeat protein